MADSRREWRVLDGDGYPWRNFYDEPPIDYLTNGRWENGQQVELIPPPGSKLQVRTVSVSPWEDA